MSGGAHTAGPWTKDRHEQLRGANGEQVGVWGAGIAWVSRSPEAEANARLISAAPALLDFAKALDASWSETFPDGPDADYSDSIIRMGDEHLALWRQCRAAIQKARPTPLDTENEG